MGGSSLPLNGAAEVRFPGISGGHWPPAIIRTTAREPGKASPRLSSFPEGDGLSNLLADHVIIYIVTPYIVSPKKAGRLVHSGIEKGKRRAPYPLSPGGRVPARVRAGETHRIPVGRAVGFSNLLSLSGSLSDGGPEVDQGQMGGEEGPTETEILPTLQEGPRDSLGETSHLAGVRRIGEPGSGPDSRVGRHPRQNGFKGTLEIGDV